METISVKEIKDLVAQCKQYDENSVLPPSSLVAELEGAYPSLLLQATKMKAVEFFHLKLYIKDTVFIDSGRMLP